MNLFYIFYLIILFLPGETIIQLCFPLKEKILRYSILEHLVYLVILGLCFSSLISLLLSISQRLSIFSLIMINVPFFLMSFFLDIYNIKLINKSVLIFRIIKAIKLKGNFLKILKKDYLVSIIISIVFIFFFISLLKSYLYIPAKDIWRYAEWAVDIAKYQPNILQDRHHISWYLGEIYYTKFYNFFLSSMILGDVESWDFIIQFIIPILIIILLILLIIDFTSKINKKINFLPVIFLSSSYYLLNWFFYSLPTTIACILGILSIISLYNKKKRSYLMFGLCVIFAYLFHTATALLFLIPIGLNLIILFLIKISSKELRRILLRKIKEKFYIYIFLSIVISAIVIGGVIVFFTPILFSPTYFEQFLDQYPRIQSRLKNYEIRSLPPDLFFWIRDLLGPHILLLSLFLIIFLVRKFIKNEKINFFKSKYSGRFSNGKVKTQDITLNNLFFFWVFLVILILICIFLPIWYWFSTFPYQYYRYFIYIDLACLFLAPFGFDLIIKYLAQKKYKKKRISKHYVKIFYVSFISLTLYFSSFHFFIRDYNLYNVYEDIPEANLNIYYWLRDNTDNDSIYCASPYSDCGEIYYHPILNDRKFLDPSYQYRFFNDSQYSSIYDIDYLHFLRYLYVLRKLINLRFASSDYTAIYTKDKVDYIILDDYYNPNLSKLMSLDNNSFLMLKNWTDWRPFTKEPYHIYLFYYKDYYNFFFNPTFEYEYPEWFLVEEKYNETLNRSDFDPYEGDYSLLYNRSVLLRRGYFIISKDFTLSSQYNYSFSCYLKYILYPNENATLTIRFLINYYDYDWKLISHENVYTLKNYNFLMPYSLVNFTFPIIPGSYYEQIEVELEITPSSKVIILLDNIFLKRVV